ncbi:hypothetical protein NDK47_23765 [Brevibacillus ruminantium]|uniref:DUF4855 domain-containing protein n=1 Tax=Brevibacillus ruminantium TaxID=2950604 RepID=A0ABY4WID0_9BACL|nr:hypothetical protein [Brevibacillus ruminantium]USG65104.1 hypothetical protein NDK47_23765 [Brevibacillus ruminantium]
MAMRNLLVYIGKQYDPIRARDLDKLDDVGLNHITLEVGLGSNKFRYDDDRHNRSIVDFCINGVESFFREYAKSVFQPWVWVGLPQYELTERTVTKERDLYRYYRDYIDGVRERLEAIGRWEDVRGFYYSMEAVQPIQEKISETSPTSTPSVRLMNDISYHIHNQAGRYGNQFLWCPYYGYGSYQSNIIHNLGVIANRTNIFDHILVQPQYYFRPAVKENVNAVRNSVTDRNWDQEGEIVDLNGNPVAGGRRASASASIGVVMEINVEYFSEPDYADRYNYYDRRFTRFLQPRSDTPFTFYAGQLSSVLEKKPGGSLDRIIKAFYDQRKNF